MLFHTPIFLGFFIIVFSTYWLLPSKTLRKSWLLVASYVFYACWDSRFCLLLLFSTLLDYTIAYCLTGCRSEKKRRVLITLSLIGNLGVLGFFKYFNFFIDSLMALALKMGVTLNSQTLAIILPVGISFYTFQTLSYTIDVYRRKIPAEKKFLNVALFVAFFPQLVAGPIVHAKDFMHQLYEKKFFKEIPWRACILLFMFGLVKKVVVADNLAVAVDAIFSRYGQFNSWTIIVGVMLFAIQIYCDFSGYSDMAIAISRVFGFHLPMNFAWPYFSKNVSEFWRRWHISLSTWWRDYFYIPLGGNQHGILKQDRNLLITMLVAGLWHGAAWTFVIWGMLHGLALIIYHHVKKGLIKISRIFTIWAVKPQLFYRLRKFGAFTTVWVLIGSGYYVLPDLSAGALTVSGTSILFLGSLFSYRTWFYPKKWWRLNLPAQSEHTPAFSRQEDEVNFQPVHQKIAQFYLTIYHQVMQRDVCQKIVQLLSILLTFWLVCLCWIYFRAPSFYAANGMAKKFLFLKTTGKTYFSTGYYIVILLLILCHYLTYRYQPVKNAEKIPTVIFAIFTGLLFALFLLAQPIKAMPFLYFQF